MYTRVTKYCHFCDSTYELNVPIFAFGLPWCSEVKASASNEGDLASIPGLGRCPGEGNGNPPTPVFLPGESHGGRSLVGYSPQGHKESDTTERLICI